MDLKKIIALLPIAHGDLVTTCIHFNQAHSCILSRISSIPIIDDEGALINVYSQSDVTSLIRGNVYAHIHLDQTTISQALELVDGANHNRYRICKRSDSLYSIMELLSNPVVRRVIVIDADSRRVEDIITLRDIFNFILC